MRVNNIGIETVEYTNQYPDYKYETYRDEKSPYIKTEYLDGEIKEENEEFIVIAPVNCTIVECYKKYRKLHKNAIGIQIVERVKEDD